MSLPEAIVRSTALICITILGCKAFNIIERQGKDALEALDKACK